MPTARRIVLASASPRRADLLRQVVAEFETVPPPVREPDLPPRAAAPACLAEAMSYFKASSVAGGQSEALIVAADTIVAVGDRLFGKPRDEADARRILSALQGTWQDVITGVTVLEVPGGERLIRHARTRVHMRPMTDAELDDYLQTGQWRGKAGAYGIQDEGDRFIDRVEGSRSNVVGLPVELVREMLAAFDVPLSGEPPEGRKD